MGEELSGGGKEGSGVAVHLAGPHLGAAVPDGTATAGFGGGAGAAGAGWRGGGRGVGGCLDEEPARRAAGVIRPVGGFFLDLCDPEFNNCNSINFNLINSFLK